VNVSYQQHGRTGILRSHNPRAMGEILPFVAEFWRSSMSTLMSHILGERFPSTAMYFPYTAPRHADTYTRVFGCPVEFSSDVMEWHFDAGVLGRPCQNADAVTSNICQDFCEQIVHAGEGQSRLQQDIRRLCLLRRDRSITAKTAASELGLSLRTLYRRLSNEGVTFQHLHNETWRAIAIEYLKNTSLPIDEIAYRCGYSDASNFRKAFRRWTGSAPSFFRCVQAVRTAKN
jgi:AraC-like DNA-binding protein